MDERSRHTDRIREQFTKQAEAYSRMRETRDEAGLPRLVAACGAKPTDRVLDVACGPGFLTMAFAERAAHATGVDATDELLARARSEAASRGLENIEFRKGDAYTLDLASGAFDIAACRAAFHHFVDPAAVLGEMKRVLRPGGRLMVADMLGSEEPRKAAAHDHIERLCDPTHVRALPESELTAMFAAQGLRTVLRRTARIEYDAEEWMDHGGPDADVRRQIVDLLEASMERDDCGLAVRREAGRIRFSHLGGVFVLEAS